MERATRISVARPKAIVGGIRTCTARGTCSKAGFSAAPAPTAQSASSTLISMPLDGG